MLMSRRFVIVLSLATFILYAWPLWKWLKEYDRRLLEFVIDSPATHSERETPYMAQEFISPDAGVGMVHSASICQLQDGRLAVVWYGGSKEGARDAAIYLTLRHPGDPRSWTEPRVIVDSETASKELSRFVKTVGNSIIFAGHDNRIWLIYVSVSFGGWSGSALNVKISDDGGTTWTASQRLTLSPFLNMSELVRNNPLPLAHGGFAIPVYHECLGKFPELLWIRADQATENLVFKKTRMTGGRAFIQPCVVVNTATEATTFYRNCSADRSVWMAVTEDAGATWSAPRRLELPNPDSDLSALLLSGGRILLAFNDTKYYRENLSLAISRDAGVNWMRVATLEDMEGQEFSYPYLIRSRDGRIHLVYTWRRKGIKHVEFNEAWLRTQMKKVQK